MVSDAADEDEGANALAAALDLVEPAAAEPAAVDDDAELDEDEDEDDELPPPLEGGDGEQESHEAVARGADGDENDDAELGSKRRRRSASDAPPVDQGILVGVTAQLLRAAATLTPDVARQRWALLVQRKLTPADIDRRAAAALARAVTHVYEEYEPHSARRGGYGCSEEKITTELDGRVFSDIADACRLLRYGSECMGVTHEWHRDIAGPSTALYQSRAWVLLAEMWAMVEKKVVEAVTEAANDAAAHRTFHIVHTASSHDDERAKEFQGLDDLDDTASVMTGMR